MSALRRHFTMFLDQTWQYLGFDDIKDGIHGIWFFTLLCVEEVRVDDNLPQQKVRSPADVLLLNLKTSAGVHDFRIAWSSSCALTLKNVRNCTKPSNENKKAKENRVMSHTHWRLELLKLQPFAQKTAFPFRSWNTYQPHCRYWNIVFLLKLRCRSFNYKVVKYRKGWFCVKQKWDTIVSTHADVL